MNNQIDNPIINSAFKEPTRHFVFDESGITSETKSGRRPSGVYAPVPKAKSRQQKLELENVSTTWTNETFRENDFVNRIRDKVSQWRLSQYEGSTNVTKRLLEHWQREERERRFFFCQIEALETIIYITEIAEKTGETWILNELRKYGEEFNSGLYRIALKMATGSGKTVVMAMIITWQAVNKAHYRQDTRFSDTFAIIAPGITIRDRLAVLQPNNPNNYYDKLDVVPQQYKDFLNQADITIVNYHAMMQRGIERYKGSRVVKESARKESPSAMINRAFRSLKSKKNIVVINDESHHCYISREMEEKLVGDDRKEAEKNNEEARVWHSGIQALNAKLGVRMTVDLSATPYYLKGSGFPEGTLFPWVVSDFDLIDAIESGIVKIPRIPVRDDAINKDDIPSYRHLWLHIKDDLPKRGNKTGDSSDVPMLPSTLETALYSLYENYQKSYQRYEVALEKNPNVMPPVLIVVCSNTTVSEMVYKWIAGYEIKKDETTRLVPGKLPIFRNEENDRWFDRANTLLVDSVALESGDAVNETFKEAFKHEIKEFREEYQNLYPGRDEPADEDMLREVMNTVGKKGKLGENIKCVVSVSMLTEGWDANTVTHVLGVRAFSTQLLCEQVVGRALRRVSYEADEQGMFHPEYAEVYGVPFLFMKTDGSESSGTTPTQINRVHALDERDHLEITFPRLEGYRHEFDLEKLEATFSDTVRTTIENIPTEVVVADVLGSEERHTLDTLKTKRDQEVVYALAKYILERYFADEGGNTKYWLFPQIKDIAARYVKTHIKLKDNMFIGLLLLESYFKDAATNINAAIAASVPQKKIMPILTHYDTLGSTQYVDRITTKPVRETEKSHVNYVIADTEEWEQGVAKKLEDMAEVRSYVKNEGLEFYIPYEFRGVTRSYMPDFIVQLETSTGVTNLIIEVTGKKDEAKAIKVETARTMWVPAVNNYGAFGTWAFLEIQDIHETQNLIRYGIEHGFDTIK
ncbi:MAG: DEAD/DEAH box helicase family protein [Candidatus Pacebacteria bacterium]|nr:DEAD/DEAH box helicase family protein [Candidatus Paceibacterota bacterium]